MKKLYFLFFMASAFCSAQTTLVPGDIAIIQAQGDDPDSFAFVTFVDIDAGTGIYFTDCGVSGITSQFRSPACTEGARKYTAPTGGLSAGAIIKFTGTGGDFAVYSDSRITGNFLLSTGGDQVVAFQDVTSAAGGSNAGNNPSFIFITSYASTGFTGDPTDSNETSLPSTLSNTSTPATAMALGSGPGDDNEWDNVIYNGTYDFSGEADLASSLAAAKLALTNPANYLQVNIIDAAYSAAVANMPPALMLFTLSTDEFSLDNALSVYPNPSNGLVTIGNSGIALENVQVTDVNGRVVAHVNLNGTTESKQLNLNQLTSGLYFVTIASKEASTVKKLIIK